MMDYKNLPSVDKVLKDHRIGSLMKEYGQDLVKFCVRKSVSDIRSGGVPESVGNSKEEYMEYAVSLAVESVRSIASPTLKPVINGSGIILHTNLGRAPYGEQLINDAVRTLKGYTNLEFDLETGMRGERNSHARELIKYLTSAEDAVVVNNNAAAVILILSAFGNGRETIVSRGELVEVGGSFRIPDVMKASGSIMREVGTTNKTRLSDYAEAMNENTAILFKAHKSNYVISGFTEEVALKDMARLAKENGLISVYDIGSGLLRKTDCHELDGEPTVKEALEAGADLVCFSGDKLLGGAQAGIIAGRKDLIAVLKRHPLMRALRVCKMTLALLETACSYYLDDEKLYNNNILFKTLRRSDEELSRLAQCLDSVICKYLGTDELTEVVRSRGQYGGGTLPDLVLDSYSVRLKLSSSQRNADKGKQLYHELLSGELPVLANLVKGEIYLDVLCIEESMIPQTGLKVANSYLKCIGES